MLWTNINHLGVPVCVCLFASVHSLHVYVHITPLPCVLQHTCTPSTSHTSLYYLQVLILCVKQSVILRFSVGSSLCPSGVSHMLVGSHSFLVYISQRPVSVGVVSASSRKGIIFIVGKLVQQLNAQQSTTVNNVNLAIFYDINSVIILQLQVCMSMLFHNYDVESRVLSALCLSILYLPHYFVHVGVIVVHAWDQPSHAQSSAT